MYTKEIYPAEHNTALSGNLITTRLTESLYLIPKLTTKFLNGDVVPFRHPVIRVLYLDLYSTCKIRLCM